MSDELSNEAFVRLDSIQEAWIEAYDAEIFRLIESGVDISEGPTPTEFVRKLKEEMFMAKFFARLGSKKRMRLNSKQKGLMELYI